MDINTFSRYSAKSTDEENATPPSRSSTTDDPFADDTTKSSRLSTEKQFNNEPANAYTPEYAGNGFYNDKLNELLVREASVRGRELDLDKRQAEVERLERVYSVKEPNWPLCKPFIYHHIKDDIPKEGQGIVLRGYIAWYLAGFVYLFNAVSCLAMLIAGVPSIPHAGADFGWSVAYLIIGFPVAFVFWYRPLYNAVKKNRSVLFAFFFFSFACHMIFTAFLIVGVPGSGSGGFINMLSLFSAEKTAEGIILAVNTGFMFVQVIYGLVEIGTVNSYFKSGGHTWAQARQQAMADFATSNGGRAVVSQALK